MTTCPRCGQTQKPKGEYASIEVRPGVWRLVWFPPRRNPNERGSYRYRQRKDETWVPVFVPCQD